MSMASAEALQKWLSNDLKEAVIVLSGDYWLIHMQTRESKLLGKSSEEAKKSLEALNKSSEFPNF